MTNHSFRCRTNKSRSLSALSLCAAAAFLGGAITCPAQQRAAAGGHPENLFGRQLAVVADLKLGPSVDVTVSGKWIYVIGQGKLAVADISEPGAPKVVGRLAGLGNTRQIAVKDGIAYITAREDGMFIVDVSRPEDPRLLSHYDTIELATGIAVSGRVAFVACRTYGVELVDVSDPRRPVHLSTVRTGEAQSCVARDGILYAGVWETSELVISDIRNPRKPVIIAKAPLDGYGDGVDIKGKYCFVATGHHARGVKNPRERTKPQGVDDPAYGHGHGLEIFDVSNPAKPVWVSRVKFPPTDRRTYFDAWSVEVQGTYAFVGDTINGMFVVDLSNIAKPRFAAHKQWGPDGFVRGLAVGKDHVYVAAADLHVLAAPGMAAPRAAEMDRPPRIRPAKQTAPAGFRLYHPGGQVYAVAFEGDTALVAAGSAGLHEVQVWPRLAKRREYKTDGFAMDIKVLGPRVFVAEGRGGMSIWERAKDGSLARIGRYLPGPWTVKQVVVPPPGKYALVHVGGNSLHIVEITDPARPRLAFKDSHGGLMYGYHIANGLIDGRYASCGWAYSSYHWYDLYGGPAPVLAGTYALRFDAYDGIATLNGKALLIHHGKYVLIDPKETRLPDSLPNFGVPGHQLSGKPSIYGSRLYVSDRFWGKVSVLDISHIETPRLLDSYQFDGNPGIAVEHKNTLFIPGGYQGLLVQTANRGGRSR